MMLSITAYDLLNVIVEGEVTIHTLRLGLRDRGFSDSGTNEVLLNCLIELCEERAVECRVEDTYGDTTSDATFCRSGAELAIAWERLFGLGGPEETEVTSSTISVQKTALGAEAALDDKYDVYLPFLREKFGWPDE